MTTTDGDPKPSGYVITVEAHHKQMDDLRLDLVAKMMRQRGVAAGLLGELIDWFGAPDWSGPQLPIPLARRIAEFLEDGAPAGGDSLPATADPRGARLVPRRDPHLCWRIHSGTTSPCQLPDGHDLTPDA